MHHKLGTENAFTVEKAFLRWVQREESKEKKNRPSLADILSDSCFSTGIWSSLSHVPISRAPQGQGTLSHPPAAITALVLQKRVNLSLPPAPQSAWPIYPCPAAAALPALLRIWPHAQSPRLRGGLMRGSKPGQHSSRGKCSKGSSEFLCIFRR